MPAKQCVHIADEAVNNLTRPITDEWVLKYLAGRPGDDGEIQLADGHTLTPRPGLYKSCRPYYLQHPEHGPAEITRRGELLERLWYRDSPAHPLTPHRVYAVSLDNKEYFGHYVTRMAAVEFGEVFARPGRSFYVAETEMATPPAMFFDSYEWLRNVRQHDDYAADYKRRLSPKEPDMSELDRKVRKVIGKWLQRHGFDAQHRVVVPGTISHISTSARKHKPRTGNDMSDTNPDTSSHYYRVQFETKLGDRWWTDACDDVYVYSEDEVPGVAADGIEQGLGERVKVTYVLDLTDKLMGEQTTGD